MSRPFNVHLICIYNCITSAVCEGVDAEKPVDAPVPLVLFNQESAPGIAGGAGVVTQGIYEVTVRAKPFDVPAEIQVDCIVLESIELSIITKDLVLDSGRHSIIVTLSPSFAPTLVGLCADILLVRFSNLSYFVTNLVRSMLITAVRCALSFTTTPFSI